jgi:hypothetical protein
MTAVRPPNHDMLCSANSPVWAGPHTHLTNAGRRRFVAAAIKELARVVYMIRQNRLYIRALGCLTVINQ